MSNFQISFLLGMAFMLALVAYTVKPKKPPRRAQRKSPGVVNGEDHL